jgi:hypothetical protein
MPTKNGKNNSKLLSIRNVKEKLKSKSDKQMFSLNMIEFLKRTLSEPNIYSNLFRRRSTLSTNNLLNELKLGNNRENHDEEMPIDLSFSPNNQKCSSIDLKFYVFYFK